MAVQNTMGTTTDKNFYVTKTAFYWVVGVIVLLFIAVSVSMSQNINRLSTTSSTPPTIDNGTNTGRVQQGYDTSTDAQTGTQMDNGTTNGATNNNGTVNGTNNGTTGTNNSNGTYRTGTPGAD